MRRLGLPCLTDDDSHMNPSCSSRQRILAISSRVLVSVSNTRLFHAFPLHAVHVLRLLLWLFFVCVVLYLFVALLVPATQSTINAGPHAARSEIWKSPAPRRFETSHVRFGTERKRNLRTCDMSQYELKNERAGVLRFVHSWHYLQYSVYTHLPSSRSLIMHCS